MATYSIGQLAKRLGCTSQALRYYEEEGLIPPPVRTEGNQRRYGEQHLQRLLFIRHGRELGFSLEAITELLKLAAHSAQPCAMADEIARAQLQQVRSRISRLKALETELATMVEQCACETVVHCKVIEVLQDHHLCHHEQASSVSMAAD